jgi:hypothetical protein
MVAYEIFQSLGVEVQVRPVIEHISKHFQDNELEEEGKPELMTHYHVGEKLGPLINTGAEWGECWGIAEVYEAYPSTLMKVTWMNAPTEGTKNMQFAFSRVSICAAC